MDENEKIILESLSTALSNEQPETLEATISIMLNKINLYLKTLDIEFLEINNRYEQIVAQNSDLEEASQRYMLYKEIKNNEIKMNRITEIIIKGYSLIEEIRKFFTNETIVYGVATGTGNYLYEANFTFEQLSNFIRLDINTSKTNVYSMLVLRLYDKTGLNKAIKDIQTIQNQGKNAENVLSNSISEASSVYSAVYRFAGESEKTSYGRAHEAYKMILRKRQSSGYGNRVPPPVRIDTIRNAFNAVSQDSVPFYKGGDYNNIQYKAWLNSPATVIKTSGVKETLTTIQKIFQSFIDTGKKKQLSNSLKSFFLKDIKKDCVDKIEKEAVKIAKEYLDNVIENFSPNVILT